MSRFYISWDAAHAKRAEQVIESHGWRPKPQPGDQFRLHVGDEGLQLESLLEKAQPLKVRWSQNQSLVSLRRRYPKKDPWIKSLGGIQEGARVIDATLGFGHDAFIMAALGFEVQAFEREPLIYELTSEAYQQLPSEFAEVKRHLRLQLADFTTADISGPIDIVYLDPMYPDRNKSALPRKEMRWLKEIVADGQSDERMFAKALNLRPKRVVVKRPKAVGHLTNQNPHVSFLGQSTRYDVYFCDPNI